MNEHMKSVHWQVKNYQCELCSYCSSFKNDLMKHTVSKHTERIGEQKPIKTEGKVNNILNYKIYIFYIFNSTFYVKYSLLYVVSILILIRVSMY